MIFRHVSMPIRTDQAALLQADPDQTWSVQDATFGICRTFPYTAVMASPRGIALTWTP
jgi:hypothetical protein